MLLQHKAELGVKHVTHVTIFRDDDSKEPGLLLEVQLLFWIEDVPVPVAGKQDGDGVRIHEFRARM
jgi:hypothetical protein